MKRTVLTLAFVLAIASGLAAAGAESQANKVEVTVKDVDSFTYCCVTHKGAFSEISEAINQLILNLQQQNLAPMGPMIGIYHGDPTVPDSASKEWEVGFPVVEQATLQPPLQKKQWIFKTVASAVHVGPFENSGETIGQILLWMQANGYDQAGPVLEKYMDLDPSQVNPNNLRTEIWIPCLKGDK